MRREPLGLLLAALGTCEAFPEARGFARVVAGFGEQLDADQIGFALVRAAVRQDAQILRTFVVAGEDQLLLGVGILGVTEHVVGQLPGADAA